MIIVPDVLIANKLHSGGLSQLCCWSPELCLQQRILGDAVVGWRRLLRLLLLYELAGPYYPDRSP